MQRTGYRRIFAVGALCFATLHAAPATAQVPTGPTTAPAETGEAGARKHFDRSLELYRAGRYAEALEQLKRAAELDPNGKDLFFNLSLVHEKLGQLPQAIAALERFRELETDAKERDRARIIIERLRGAQQAAEPQQPSPPPCAPGPAPAPHRAAPNPVLIGAASVAAVSLVVGTIFGIKALSDDVSDASTSESVSVEQLRARGRRAEREALVADVALALGLASSATFVSVWLLTPKEPTGSAARGGGITLRGYF